MSGVVVTALADLTVELRGERGPLVDAIAAVLAGEGARIADSGASGLPDILLLCFPLLPHAGTDDTASRLDAARVTGEAMAARGRGRILFLLSAMAGLPARRHAAYSVGMAAALAGMRVLAMTLAPNVLVNAVGAGTIETAGTLVAGDRDFLGHAAVPRSGTVDEVVAAVLFFCDPGNSYTTGQMLAVDGGWMAGYGRTF